MRILAISHLLNMEFITDLSQDLFMFLWTNVGYLPKQLEVDTTTPHLPREEECYLETILQDKQALTDYTLTRNQVQKVVLQPICKQDKASGFQPSNCSVYYIICTLVFHNHQNPEARFPHLKARTRQPESSGFFGWILNHLEIYPRAPFLQLRWKPECVLTPPPPITMHWWECLKYFQWVHMFIIFLMPPRTHF